MLSVPVTTIRTFKTVRIFKIATDGLFSGGDSKLHFDGQIKC